MLGKVGSLSWWPKVLVEATNSPPTGREGFKAPPPPPPRILGGFNVTLPTGRA